MGSRGCHGDDRVNRDHEVCGETKEGSVSISLTNESILIGVNACRTRNYVIVTPAKNINNWLKLFIKLKMYDTSLTSKVLLATNKNPVHMKHILANGDHSKQVIITNPTAYHLISKCLISKYYITDVDNCYPNSYKSIVRFTDNAQIKIVKGYRPTYNVKFDIIPIKYNYDIDLYQFGNKILAVNFENVGNMTESEFNKSEKCIIDDNNIETTVCPDAVVSMGYFNISFVRSYTDNSTIPYYVLCLTDYELFNLHFRIRNDRLNVHILWALIKMMNIDVLKLTNIDYSFLLNYSYQSIKYKNWTADNSAFTQEQIMMFNI